MARAELKRSSCGSRASPFGSGTIVSQPAFPGANEPRSWSMPSAAAPASVPIRKTAAAIYCAGDEQLAAAIASRDAYQPRLAAAGHGAITTEIAPAPPFYYAEAYHSSTCRRTPAATVGWEAQACRARWASTA